MAKPEMLLLNSCDSTFDAIAKYKMTANINGAEMKIKNQKH